MSKHEDWPIDRIISWKNYFNAILNKTSLLPHEKKQSINEKSTNTTKGNFDELKAYGL